MKFEDLQFAIRIQISWWFFISTSSLAGAVKAHDLTGWEILLTGATASYIGWTEYAWNYEGGKYLFVWAEWHRYVEIFFWSFYFGTILIKSAAKLTL